MLVLLVISYFLKYIIHENTKNKHKLDGQTLHAHILGFKHPTTEEYIETIAPIPAYFEKLLKILQN